MLKYGLGFRVRPSHSLSLSHTHTCRSAQCRCIFCATFSCRFCRRLLRSSSPRWASPPRNAIITMSRRTTPATTGTNSTARCTTNLNAPRFLRLSHERHSRFSRSQESVLLEAKNGIGATTAKKTFDVMDLPLGPQGQLSIHHKSKKAETTHTPPKFTARPSSILLTTLRALRMPTKSGNTTLQLESPKPTHTSPTRTTLY
jgi:hypothetical protein